MGGFERGTLVTAFGVFFIAVVMVGAYTGAEASPSFLAVLAFYLLLLALPCLLINPISVTSPTWV